MELFNLALLRAGAPARRQASAYKKGEGSKQICFALFLCLCSSSFACQKHRPVYIADREALFQGSLLYNEASCATCHGVQYDGKGPEAQKLAKDKGLSVLDFRRELAADATPINYFKAITKGTEAYPEHAYQSYTDRGRWALAHFLFRLSLPPSKKTKQRQRRQALEKMRNLLEAVYAKQRRWEMGYVPLEERPKPPKLEELLR